MLQLLLSQGTAARRRIPLYLVDATDGSTPETGITFSAGDIKVSKNGGAEANHAGTVTELAGGLYYYEFTAGELDTLGFVTARFTKSGVRTFVAVHQVVAFDPSDAAGLGLSRLDAAVSTRSSHSAADVRTEMDSNSVDLNAIIAGLVAVETDTQDIQSRLPAALDTGRIVAKAEVVSDKTGYALTSGERDAVAAALLNLADGIEAGYTVKQALRVMAAVLCGKSSGDPGSPVFRNLPDAANRVAATVDADGNRTAVTLTP